MGLRLSLPLPQSPCFTALCALGDKVCCQTLHYFSSKPTVQLYELCQKWKLVHKESNTELDKCTSAYWELTGDFFVFTFYHVVHIISHFNEYLWLIHWSISKSLQGRKNITPWVWNKAESEGYLVKILLYYATSSAQYAMKGFAWNTLTAHAGFVHLCLLSGHQVYSFTSRTWMQCRLDQRIKTQTSMWGA